MGTKNQFQEEYIRLEYKEPTVIDKKTTVIDRIRRHVYESLGGENFFGDIRIQFVSNKVKGNIMKLFLIIQRDQYEGDIVYVSEAIK